MIEEGKKYVEDNYRLSWEAAKTYKPDLIVSSLTVITEVFRHDASHQLKLKEILFLFYC